MKKLLIALVAGLAALTMSIPAHAAPSLKPTITYVDNKKPAVAGGTQITITGTNLDTVTAVTVDNGYATVAAKSKTTLTFITPQHGLGPATVLITNPAGTATFVITYSPQRRPLVPSPTLPATLKAGKTYKIVAQDPTWKVTLTTDTPKVCSVSKNVVKGLKKGSCALNIDINPDNEQGSNPNWRGKTVIDSILIN
jgi:hypothetical protein